MKFKESCQEVDVTKPTAVPTRSFVQGLPIGTVFGTENVGLLFYLRIAGGAVSLNLGSLYDMTHFSSNAVNPFKVYPDATLVYGKPKD